ncbi:LysR family transcriptional regulator [Cupriavidus consociatus]|uniref:LysR family transcriptional regulator n=1 Tax=Cupriavidus consociatus TaxID=2821357 RepID=UPI001AE5CBEF|nr:MULTISPECIES: LysR substrate-binding domain-containing protein [unclassified Cupriavidus]MBP0620705.1 LysR family transcriptional regulator [Cupriavidus sp. LEh25]MDK2657365.1 LysR substrate-binding domain-containing protein [Cupriavidus sp. LEh21]
MDLRDLKYFLAVANAGNFRRAAELVHRSQPTLTKAVDRLEASLGAALFERDGRGQKLSAAGVALRARAAGLLQEADLVRDEVGAIARGVAGTVRLGSGPLGAEYLLPPICRMLLREAPNVVLQLSIRHNYELRDDLREGRVDVILGFVPDQQDDEFHCETLLKDTVVVAAVKGHPIFRVRKPGLEALAGYRWALPNRAVPSRNWLDQTMESRNLPRPVVQIETNSIPLIPRVVADTELLTFVSRRTLRASDDDLVEVPLPAATLVRNFGVTFRKGAPLSPVADRLIGLLHEFGKTLLERLD